VGEPLSLDPGKAYDSDSAFFQIQIFEGLVTIDQDQNVLPAIAEHWQVAEGGSKYLFYLCQGARWSDGTPLTAAQFEYAWKRNLHPATNAPAAHLLHAVRNARAYREGEIDDPDLIGVKALDDYTLEVCLEGPTAYLPYLLADPITFPLPHWAIQAHGAAWTRPGNMITNGPYTLLAWQRGKQLVLERNPYYAGRFPGNAHRVECRIFSDHKPGVEAYAANDLDVADMVSGEAGVMAQIRAVHGEELIFTPRLSTNYLIFSADRGPFNDVRVRQAFSQAVDREALIRELMQEQYLPATGGVVPPGMPGHSPDIGLVYDPQAARRLLTEAGYPGGRGFPGVVFLHTHGLGDESFLPLLQRAWSRNLGVDVEITTLAWEPFLSRLEAQPPDLMLGGWIADYPDPDNYLRVVFHSREGLNEPRWQDPRFDALVEEAARVTDKRRRMALYREADRILVAEQAVILPLSYGRGAVLVKPWVSHCSKTRTYTDHLKELIVESV
jgi:ABC-type oligopeptide transport system substrate-binding subunit